MGLGTCGNRDMWGRDMCPPSNSVGTNGIGTYGVGTYGVGTCGIGTNVLEPQFSLSVGEYFLYVCQIQPYLQALQDHRLILL